MGTSKLKNALIDAFSRTGLTKNQAREKIRDIGGELLEKKVGELSLDELVLVSGKLQ